MGPTQKHTLAKIANRIAGKISRESSAGFELVMAIIAKTPATRRIML